MKYRFLRSVGTVDATYHAGREYQLGPTRAEEFLRLGFVEEIKSSTPKTVSPKRSVIQAETSVEPDVEVASDL